MEAKSGELCDLDAIKGSGTTGQWGTLNSLDPQFLLAFSPANSPAVWLCKNFLSDPSGIELKTLPPFLIPQTTLLLPASVWFMSKSNSFLLQP